MSHSHFDVLDDATEWRRSSGRKVRHDTRMQIRALVGDEDALEDAVLPVVCHDVGRRASPKATTALRPGRRGGFKAVSYTHLTLPTT